MGWKKFIPVLVIVLFFGCSAIGFNTQALETDIQGTWVLQQVSGTSCVAGILEYEFSSSSFGLGTVDSTNGKFFYSFNDSSGLITITGSVAVNGGLVDGKYYVFLKDDKMAWEFEDTNPITAYVFEKK